MTAPGVPAPVARDAAAPVSRVCCGTCVFWRDGHCIRFPPVREAGGRAWPPTMRSDLCGEHRTTGEERRAGFWEPAARRINAEIAQEYGIPTPGDRP